MNSNRRVALVTGGAKRAGRAIALKLAEAGLDVAFTWQTSEPDELRESLRATGARSIAIKADLADPERAAQTIFDAFTASFDRLDVLVNNASSFEPSASAFDITAPNELLMSVRRLNAVQFESPLLLCQKFEALLRASRGHVINMIDLLAERPTKRFLLYSASKAALSNLTLSLAAALAPEVTVNGISPGVVEWAADYPESKRARYLSRVPLGRAGSPDDVANLVHFLVTAAPYVTGQIIRLDGGRTIT